MAAVEVTRRRVRAPPDRYIDVSDASLVHFFQGVFPPDQEEQIATLHLLLDGLCGQDFKEIRRRLEGNFGFFADAAAGKMSRERMSNWGDVDAAELRFLDDFWEMMRVGHYKFLGKQEWESALSEDFMFTLPVSVNYECMDNGLLKRFWTARGSSSSGAGSLEAERANAPPELAERILIFYRGVEEAQMKGTYVGMKIDYLISFLILQPLWHITTRLLRLLRVPVPLEPPEGMFPEVLKDDPKEEQQQQQRDAAVAAAASRSHKHAIRIERRTFARVFPNAAAVLGKFFKRVSLQEACFRDVVVLYRKAVNPKQAPGEMDLLTNTEPAILARNINVKHFRSIPLADLELVLPEKTVFVPPTVLLQLAVTLVLGLMAVWGALMQDKLNMSVIYSAVALLGTRAMQIYTSATNTRTLIEKNMSKMLYERTIASQDAVLQTLTEEMGKQHTRELFVCYCVLLYSAKPMTADRLDAKCELFLSKQFGLNIDFTAEAALPTLQQWGLVTEAKDGGLQAVSLHTALSRLDEVWDGLFDFSEETSAWQSSKPGSGGGGLFSATRSRFWGSSKKKKKQAQQEAAAGTAGGGAAAPPSGPPSGSASARTLQGHGLPPVAPRAPSSVTGGSRPPTARSMTSQQDPGTPGSMASDVSAVTVGGTKKKGFFKRLRS